MDKSPENGIHLPSTPLSYWMDSTPPTDYPALAEDIKTDVAIVGGGITGLVTAYMLKKAGLRVVVLEADRIVQGTSGHTTAKVTSQHSLIYDKIKSAMGEERARQYADANETAIRIIAEIIEENSIECDFHRLPAYVYTHSKEYVQKLESEVKTASALGIKAHCLDKTPLPFPVLAAMRFDNQAQFHPRKYLLKLAEKIVGDDCRIFEHTRAVDLHEGETCSVITGKGYKVSADRIVVATHYPFYDRHGLYFSRLYPERSYALGVQIRNDFPDGMFITAEDPGRSLRYQPYGDGRLIIVGGEHHKTGHGENTMEHYEVLRDFALQIYDVENIPYMWSTQDYTSMDEIPYAGHITSSRTNIYVATGFAKWGMTNSHASAAIITDLITKGSSPWVDVYDPSRFTPGASAKNLVVENVDVAGNFISGKLSTAPDEIDIKPGEAGYVEHEGTKSGVYMDRQGKVHFVKTSCTHLGCGLKWNSAERSWDCPCHGSRFTYEGDIIDGPALKSIKFGTE